MRLILMSVVATTLSTYCAELSLSIEFKNGAFSVTILNNSESPITMFDKFELQYGILKLDVKNSNGEVVRLVNGSAEYELTPEDLIIIPARKTLNRVVIPDVALKPGKYTLNATYEVTNDSYFIENWVKGFHTDKKRDYENRKNSMLKSWRGCLNAKADFQIAAVDQK